MKELNFYQCEICGTKYNNPEAATECEALHRTISRTKPFTWGSQRGKYPEKILVIFDDESQLIYRRD